VRASFDADNGNSVKMFSEDFDGDNGEGIILTLDGSYDAGSYGAEFELQSADLQSVGLGYAYAWASFADGFVKVKAGSVDDDTWQTAGDQETDFADGLGVQLIISPLDGLSFGLRSGLDALISDTDGLLGSIDTDTFAEGLSFAAAYSSDAFNVQAGYLAAGSAYAGFALTAVENLTFAADIIAEGLADFDTDGAVTVSQTLGWSFTDALAAELICYQTFADENEFSFEPEISYSVNDMLGFSLGGGIVLADETSFSVKPGLSLTFAEDVVMSFSYTYSTSADDDDNAVQLDFVWNY
jgi:hypothetical protein